MGGLPQTVTLIVTPNETSLPAINAGSVSRKHPLRITLAVTTHLEQPTLSRKSSSAVKRQNIASPPVKAFATWWWAAEGEGLMSADTEAVVYTILDVVSKAVWAVYICRSSDAISSMQTTETVSLSASSL